MNNTEYLLICQIEEAAEIIQAACKSLRFGLDDRHPAGGADNRTKLTAECDDLAAVNQLAWAQGIIGDHSDERVKAKQERLHTWAEYSRKLGLLDSALTVATAKLKFANCIAEVPHDGCNGGEKGRPE